MIGKEISNSWGIVVPRRDCLSVEGAGIVPAAVAEKFTKIDEHDLIIYKKRMAHDCSNTGISGQSVNNMVDDNIFKNVILALSFFNASMKSICSNYDT